MKKIIGAMSFVLFFVSFSIASSFRCNDSVISVGDYISDVLSKCPSPVHTEESVRVETIKESRNKWVTQEIKRKTLTYDLGPDELIREVIIENGKVVEINTRGYGKK